GETLRDQHRVTFADRFGGGTPLERGRRRRPSREAGPERAQLRGIEDRRPQLGEPPPRPRAAPREKPAGVPGWIY
ncbi:MAG: hypothetical protein HY403_07280, partial [Elusimicrobia bacterium]|nr:hypothetical protein [Elusimicrobiota bacterium]